MQKKERERKAQELRDKQTRLLMEAAAANRGTADEETEQSPEAENASSSAQRGGCDTGELSVALDPGKILEGSNVIVESATAGEASASTGEGLSGQESERDKDDDNNSFIMVPRDEDESVGDNDSVGQGHETEGTSSSEGSEEDGDDNDEDVNIDEEEDGANEDGEEESNHVEDVGTVENGNSGEVDPESEQHDH